MRLAIVAGGWHWPHHFYERCAQLAIPDGWSVDLFVVSHRSPDLQIVAQEKAGMIPDSNDPLVVRDREFNARTVTEAELEILGWQYEDAPNIAGDWCFLNQWLERHDYRPYDVILTCHDDTYIRRDDLLVDVLGGVAGDSWLILANGRYPSAPAAYCRGSFEFLKRELLDRIGGKIDMGPLTLTREGSVDTPYADGLEGLADWNRTQEPLREWLVKNALINRVAYLSPYYRISRWVIEAERGFLHWRGGAPWSFDEGVRELRV